MKALTVLEPWATLIAEGKKVIETRNWNPDYRGKILIHSSKTLMQSQEYVNYLMNFIEHKNFKRGCIIGEAEIIDVVPVTVDFINMVAKTNYIDLATSEFNTCKFAWILDNAKYYDTPIYTKGNLGLWEFNERKLH